jgi:hypothetical protein
VFPAVSFEQEHLIIARGVKLQLQILMSVLKCTYQVTGVSYSCAMRLLFFFFPDFKLCFIA